MIDTLYIEDKVRHHPNTLAICERYPQATIIDCQHYGEVFNRKAQNFRLQKKNPAIILAYKHDNHVLPTPPAYHIGGQHNYYFSHMLNCLYDCRYCFLQGMYRSAHYVLFVNFEDFGQAIEQCAQQHAQQHPGEDVYFFSGYDCDSLALEPLTGFVAQCLPLFAGHTNAWLELRTKSTQIRALLQMLPLPNCVVAFSLSPENIVEALESKTPSLQRRLDAMQRLQAQGWLVGLRFDPLIYHQDYQTVYKKLFEQTFAALSVDLIHSVSLGVFRLPEKFYQNIVKLYPEEPLFASSFTTQEGMVGYAEHIQHEMLEYCRVELLQYIAPEKFFPCYDT